MSLDTGRDVTGVGRLPQVLHELAEPRASVCLQPRQGPLDRKRLETKAQGGDLLDGLRPDLGHEGTTEGLLYDQALFLQLGEGLSEGGAADAELGSDVRLPELGPGGQAAVEDGIFEHGDDTVQRGALIELLECHGRIPSNGRRTTTYCRGDAMLLTLSKVSRSPPSDKTPCRALPAIDSGRGLLTWGKALL